MPIYVAAAGPAVAKYAGRSGDGFICTSGKKWDLYTETLLPNVDEGIKAASAPKPDYDRMIEMKVSFDTDRERALQDTRHWAALALTPEEKMSVEDPIEMEKLAAALPVERAASRWIVSTDPDEHVEKIAPYVELGFRHLVFHAPGPDQARFLKLYGERCCRGCGGRSAEFRSGCLGMPRGSPLLRRQLVLRRLRHCRPSDAKPLQTARQVLRGEVNLQHPPACGAAGRFRRMQDRGGVEPYVAALREARMRSAAPHDAGDGINRNAPQNM